MGLFSLAEPRGRDEQPAAVAARRRRRHERDLPELGERALDRRLLLADDRRARRRRCRATLHDGLVAHGVPGGRPRRAISHLPPVATLFAAFLGYNPVQNAARRRTSLHSLTPAQSHELTGRSFFPHLISGAVPHGAHLRVRVRDRRLPRRRGRLAAARRQVPLPDRGGFMTHVRWFGQSAFLLSGTKQVFIDPFGDMSEALRARGGRFDYPPIQGVDADLVLVTHEPCGPQPGRRDRRRSRRDPGSGRNARIPGRRSGRRRVGARRCCRNHARSQHDLLLHARRDALLPFRRLRPVRAATRAARGDRRGRRAVPAGRRRPDRRS